MKDTRLEHGKSCYCNDCCDTAEDWYEWRLPNGDVALGARFWLRKDAIAERSIASEEGPITLVHVCDHS